MFTSMLRTAGIHKHGVKLKTIFDVLEALHEEIIVKRFSYIAKGLNFRSST